MKLHIPSLAPLSLIALLPFAFSSCLTQRTVSENGYVLSQELKITRPIKEALAD